MVEIREEKQGDRDAIHKLNIAAFDSGSEANLVDKLCLSCKDYLSFVAIEDGVVVGHILLSRYYRWLHSQGHGTGSYGSTAITSRKGYWFQSCQSWA